jgi:hypothetical protein
MDARHVSTTRDVIRMEIEFLHIGQVVDKADG